ncbi:hypothetical protein [Methanoplanus limicola]|uniref:Uncharacterized protein n=1 Tax=Methanoplanus limicola DSM 2279 TaxID=937775 RepID=H1YYT9_9EURY|nr:hypothetical protein [Methanoplanus limicola]EHQ37011.1 hypothetical protein Metlim_2979 [Methanoplanus limicola DSM 2279]
MNNSLFLLFAGLICIVFSCGCMNEEISLGKGLSPEKVSFESEVFHYDDYIEFVYRPDSLIPSTYFVTYSADVSGSTFYAESDRKYDGIFRDKPFKVRIPLDNRTYETIGFNIAVVDHWGRTVEQSELSVEEMEASWADLSLSVSDLLTGSDYGSLVQVSGRVSGLNTDESDFFNLTSGGSTVRAFYRDIVRETGTAMPDADISALSDGDYVILSGELQKGGNFSSRNDFWIYEVIDL